MGLVIRRALAGALVAALAGALAFLIGSARLPDLEMRSVPWRTHLGATLAERAPGQLFRCARDGLHRIDVGVNRLGGSPPSLVELVLRDGGPEGAILRRVAGSRYQETPQQSWISFEFEPVEDSGGRELHLSLLPSGGAESTWVGPWVRFRGLADMHRDWGDDLLAGPAIESQFRALQRDLRGLAFAVRAAEGPVELELLDSAGQSLRSSRIEAHTRDGWILLGFPVLAESRWREFRFRLTLPPGAEVRGAKGEPSLISFHGSGAVDPRLGGMTLGVEHSPDCDLFLRTWTCSGPGVAFALLSERVGWRLGPAILLWILSGALLANALPRPRA